MVDDEIPEDVGSGAAAGAAALGASAGGGSGSGAKIAPSVEALGVALGVESVEAEFGRVADAPSVKSCEKICSVLISWASPKLSSGTSGGACRPPGAGKVEGVVEIACGSPAAGGPGAEAVGEERAAVA